MSGLLPTLYLPLILILFLQPPDQYVLILANYFRSTSCVEDHIPNHALALPWRTGIGFEYSERRFSVIGVMPLSPLCMAVAGFDILTGGLATDLGCDGGKQRSKPISTSEEFTMKRNLITSFAIALALTLAGTGLSWARTNDASVDQYIDDARDYVDTEIIEQTEFAPTVEALAVGLEPLSIETEQPLPDDFGYPTKDGVTNDGTGPLVGTNYIRFYVSDDHVNAGSNTDYVIVRFGHRWGNDDGSTAYQLRLFGPWNGADNVFPAGTRITWDLNGKVDFFENLPQDKWDEISFVTPSGDGILLDRIVVVHSGQEILDWRVHRWLDSPNETTLGCAAKIRERKLEYVHNTDHAALAFGALEIGKTNGKKYGTGNLWCSEFASWALFREGFMTPYGNIGTDDMKAWFAARGRLYTRTQVKNRTYVPKPGDYLSLFGGDHSVLFLEWVDPTDTIIDSTRFKTLEGNKDLT